MNLRVKIKRLSEHAVIPQYAREGDAGFDLVASEDVIIEPGETALVPTGLAFELPPGYELQLRPRSGISLKTKLRVANAPATIDAGYRGEVKVIIDNIHEKIRIDGIGKVPFGKAYYLSGEETEEIGKHPHGTYIIRKGDRICQGVIKPVERAHFVQVAELDETQRGGNGFGSSGVKS